MVEKKDKGMVHLIGHAHIDPVWLWEWREGFSEVRSTFRSVLNLMERYPDFNFTCGSSCFYEWIQRIEPELFEEIVKKVAEGRWEYVGCFYVESDCNLPCGEAFVRHGLFSQLYFEKVFGRRAKVGFAPDSFGHAGSLPEIFKKLGIDFYVYMRPSPPVEKKYNGGTTFIWKSPSGASIIASVIPESYGGDGNEVLRKIEGIKTYPYWAEGQRDFLCFFGVGNHGGGPTAETIEALLKVRDETKDLRIEFSRLESYFDRVVNSEIQLSEIKGSLHHHARGCYSVHSEIKRLNRETEHLLITTEKLATLGWVLNLFSYPQRELEEAWKNLLFCQFHDVLAGTCVKRAYDDLMDFLGYSRCVAKRLINTFIQKFSKEIKTNGDGIPIIVFNPLAWDVSEVMFISEFVSKGIGEGVEFTDEQGRVFPSQVIVGDRPEGKKFAVLVDIPSMGYKVLYVRKKVSEVENKCAAQKVIKWDNRSQILENYRWKILFDSRLGGVKSLVDKEEGIEIAKNSFLPTPILDTSDTWSHNVDEFRVEAGIFKLVDEYILDLGEVLANYVQIFEFGSSKIVQKITLYSALPYIDIQIDTLWNEKNIMLKWKLDTNVVNGVATFEIPYCVETRRPTGEEEPSQQWVDLSGDVSGIPYGISIITGSNYGYDIKDNVMRVTLLRSPVYAHHDPARVDYRIPYPIIDQGPTTMRLRILPHKGNWKNANSPYVAFQFNVPFIVQFEPNHDGKRGSTGTFLRVDKYNIVISVLKKGERGDYVILRAYETMGIETDCSLYLNFLGLNFNAHFSPFEIKTFKVIDNEVIETNLLED